MRAFFVAHRTFFVLTALIVVGVFGYFWYRSGFTLDVSKFFASDVLPGPAIILSPDGPYTHGQTFIISWSAHAAVSCDSVNGWLDTGGQNVGSANSPGVDACGASVGAVGIRCTYASGETGYTQVGFDIDRSTCPLAQHLACVNSSCQKVDGAGSDEDGCTFLNQSCGGSTPTPTPTPTATSSVTHLECQSNACVQVDGGGGNQDGCTANGQTCGVASTNVCTGHTTQNFNGVTWCLIGGTLSTAACQNASSGDMNQQWGIINDTNDNYTVVLNGFHDPVSSCNGTSTAPSGGTSLQGNSIPAHSSGITTIHYNGSRYDCGRVQLDGCIKNEATGSCGGGLTLGSVINYNQSCVVATPTPTVISTPTQTPTPTPSTPTSPTPSSSVLPGLSCAANMSQATTGQTVTFTATGGTGTYGWYAPDATPATGAGTTLGTAYAKAGLKVVTVASGDNQATCLVTIVAPTISVTPTPSTTASPTISPTLSPTISPTLSPTVTPLSPALNIVKLVRNVTTNGTDVDSTNAHPSDTVEFSMSISSVGSGNAVDVVVRDSLPAGLTYQTGTTTIDGINAADGIIGTGLNLGTLAPGRTVIVRFRALVAPAAFFSVGTTSLVNTAYVRGLSIPEISDTAFVNVIKDPQSLSMSLTKMGRNTTRGQLTGEYSPVNASPTNVLEFIIHVRNTASSVLTNVVVHDIVPQGITYIAGTTRLNGQLTNDTLVTSGLNIGSLLVGQEAVVTFSGRVAPANQLPVGTTTLINTAQATADGVPPLTAQLPIVITNPTVSIPPIPTGPGESTVLALIVSAIITLLYVGYTGTNAYRRGEVSDLARQARRDGDSFNFRR